VPKKPTRNHVDDVRGVSRLAVEATTRVTDVVEAMHNTIGGGPAILGQPLARPVRLLNKLVYGNIRAVTRLVGASLELALAPLSSWLGESAPGPERETLLAALNGVIGDYLTETRNPLAMTMRLRHDGHALELTSEALRAKLPRAGGKLLVLLHGSCANDLHWKWYGHDYGASLADEHGYTPLHVQYNSGLHVSTNGRELDALLERLVTEWPVPVDELVLLGHSMGGLVARSACHYGEEDGARAWRHKLTKLVCMGTPHHGAPLERIGNIVQTAFGVSRYSAPLARLGKLRSAGITDLRFGNVLDEHWSARDRFAHGHDPRADVKLPEGVACYAIAGSTSPEGHAIPFGDGMVSVESALGRHDETHLTLGFPEAHQWVCYGTSHLQLVGRAEVYAKLREWLSPRADVP
jgi:pimeloyl-ACP methyl ester carboxylesterase